MSVLLLLLLLLLWPRLVQFDFVRSGATVPRMSGQWCRVQGWRVTEVGDAEGSEECWLLVTAPLILCSTAFDGTQKAPM